MRANEFQRHIWFLRDGSCTVLRKREDVPKEEVAEEDDKSETDEEAEYKRLSEMRKFCYGAEQQQGAAASVARCKAASQYARGAFRRALSQGQKRLPNASAGDDSLPAAVVGEPGAAIGAEVLLYENFRDIVGAKCPNTVRTETDSAFLTADISAFRQLGMFMSVKVIAAGTAARFERQDNQLLRGESVGKELRRSVLRAQRRERERTQRQQLRLPAYSGYRGPTELEDVNDWLEVVFNHRKEPLNLKNPPTLTCLENINNNLDGRPSMGATGGPGVKAILKVVGGEGAGRRQLGALLRARRGFDRSHGLSDMSANPLGDTVSAKISFVDAPLPGHESWAALTDGPTTAPPSGDDGIFFHTELDIEEARLTLPQAPARSSSVPVLPDINGARAKEECEKFLSQKSQLDSRNSLARSESQGSLRQSRVSASTEKVRVMKAFHRAVLGKTLLVLTDKPEARKSIMHAVQSAEVAVQFVKTTNDLWAKLRDSKEQHHLLVIDLCKHDLQVENVLRTVRQHAGYERLPIVVLSADEQLPDVVRTSCSYVIFKPLAASMVREALVWCFDRRALKGQVAIEASANDSQEAPMHSKLSLDVVGGPALKVN